MTQYISNDKYCNYLDFNKYPAERMLQNCIGSEENNCGYQINTQMFNTTIDQRTFSDRSLIEGTASKSHRDISKDVVEGFVSGSGPGVSQIPTGECPESYKKCDQTGLCKQVCRNCKLSTGKSLSMNEHDPCFPNGVFNGYDNNGELICSCGKNNEYCNDKKNIYTVGGILLL